MCRVRDSESMQPERPEREISGTRAVLTMLSMGTTGISGSQIWGTAAASRGRNLLVLTDCIGALAMKFYHFAPPLP